MYALWPQFHLMLSDDGVQDGATKIPIIKILK